VHLDYLPEGGGIVVADGNTWSVRNDLSVSQYCWPDEESRATFLAALDERGYKAISVSNKLTESLYRSAGMTQPLAVVALYHYAARLVEANGSFDSGHAVRPSRGDNSFGQRRTVVEDFLRLQNTNGYDSPFADDVVKIAWAALTPELRPLFRLNKRSAICKPADRNRLMAVAVCTHDPRTGVRRTHQGRAWGMGFITRHIIGLNGVMRGTGERAPGNPMRAVLRILGRRHSDKINAAERSDMDRSIRIIIRALQAPPQLSCASASSSTGPVATEASSLSDLTAGEPTTPPATSSTDPDTTEASSLSDLTAGEPLASTSMILDRSRLNGGFEPSRIHGRRGAVAP
jgi:hypothetical protein